jgi:hypothetical protein
VLLSIENEGSRQSSRTQCPKGFDLLFLGRTDPTDTRQRILIGRFFERLYADKAAALFLLRDYHLLDSAGFDYFCGRASDAEPLIVSFDEGVR